MKDIKGKSIVKGDSIVILENGNRIPATVLGIGKTKVKLKLKEGNVIVEQEEIKVQKITAKGNTGNRKVTGLLEDIFKDTNPVVNSRSNLPGVGLETLRLFGVGFDTKHPAMRLTEDQKKYNTYGKVYRLLKEAYDEASEDAELEEVANAISKVATYLNNKMDQ